MAVHVADTRPPGRRCIIASYTAIGHSQENCIPSCLACIYAAFSCGFCRLFAHYIPYLHVSTQSSISGCFVYALADERCMNWLLVSSVKMFCSPAPVGGQTIEVWMTERQFIFESKKNKVKITRNSAIAETVRVTARTLIAADGLTTSITLNSITM